jgi:putative addiction module component (TIGR02574 family)
VTGGEAMDYRAVLEAAIALSVEDRLRLADEIYESVEADDHAELSDEMKRELDRRIAADDANPEAGSSWEEVKARLMSDL